ncbi:MAG: histidinol phosphate phosphatase [Sulfuricurvum sp. MLSB]|uniref:histidinol-phosphatase HisJ family protein n=1 Tax=Sulfuricurvum sp. MLSB TaxID=1537917 RepID=UPI000501903B|nr:histidinol-phosphatase HisJ family protein [Sulfuricurvum sp. MLSB]KFN39098.1 MAG: histidinol phosphate phosphatase [Sulfuricurvum sp. MLSB]
MKVDLHNHTALCNHATGTVDEYVEAAIACGTQYFGFSDHAPMHFDPQYRMSFDEMAQYEAWVYDAQERYSDKIAVLMGYEVDFLPGYMDEQVLERSCDYLIGSVHFIDEWGFDNPEFIGRYQRADIDAIYRRYFELVETMAKSGRFDIVGHLDLLKVFKYLPKTDIRFLARDALKAIKRANMVIEINVAGWRKPIAEAYPSPSLLEEIAELEIPITFGSDAHRPDQVGLYSDEVEAVARQYGYTKCALYRGRDRELIKF